MNWNVALTLFGTFFVFLILNFPIALALGLSSMITILAFQLVPIQLIPQLMEGSTYSWTLLAIPLFILAGTIMSHTEISKRLTNFASKIFGSIAGGLGIVGIIASIFLAGISGSGPADVAALGTILIPAMIKRGYDKGFASALVASGGGIGIIVPPSIALVIYGVVADVSISKLFIAGIIPGILVGLSLIFMITFISRKKGFVEREKPASFREILISFKEAIWGLIAPLIILGGIYGGIFTPTEAASVAVFYSLFVGFVIHRDLKLKDLPEILIESGIISSVVMFIVITASVFSWILNTQGIAKTFATGLLNFSSNKVLILLLINLVILLAGMIMDAISIFYVFLPIILPVAEVVGIDPIHLGVIMTVNLAIGQITPPIGVNLFVACGISKIDLKTISKAVIPFILAEVTALLIITFIPPLSTYLPSFMR